MENKKEKAAQNLGEIVRISIAYDELNKGDKEVHAGINGEFFTIPRNTKNEEFYTEVPRQIAILLKEAGYPVSTEI